MQDMVMAAVAPMAWTPGYAVLMFFMWWIMMMAMMLPSAAPMILLFAMINRKQRENSAPYVPTGIFAAGYLLVWGAFSLVAVAAQGPGAHGLLSSMMVGTSVLLGAGLLVAAGAYQLSPLKHACCGIAGRRSSSSAITGVGQARRAAHGRRARRVLHRLLLVPDGAAVLRRHHEPVLDRRPGRVRAPGRPYQPATGWPAPPARC